MVVPGGSSLLSPAVDLQVLASVILAGILKNPKALFPHLANTSDPRQDRLENTLAHCPSQSPNLGV